MAKIGGPIGTHFGGRFGKALVYGTWKGIIYVRKKPIPTYTRTKKQAEIRNLFAAAVFEWQGLSDLVKTMWRAACYGTRMSGYELFIKNFVKSRYKGL